MIEGCEGVVISALRQELFCVDGRIDDLAGPGLSSCEQEHGSDCGGETEFHGDLRQIVPASS